MTLAKLTIAPRKPSNLSKIEVLFNPTSYSISKSVSWNPLGEGSAKTQRELNAPLLTFGGGGSRTLTLNLFFDVTEPVNGNRVDDVRKLTNRFVELTRIERSSNTPRPPVCDITWGSAAPQNSDFPFTGVVTSLNQEFTLFRSDGKPVRANLTVSFTEFLEPEKDQRETDPEFTTRLVKRGDTLSSIAVEAYNDPTRWRLIADTNNLDNPRILKVGSILKIPESA
ncbi:MAG: LysM peptidoglycan-binding domain-containing protein [Acidobacteriota bacterium]